MHLPGRCENGYFISPCILTECHDEMTAVREEIFGPVITILVFDTEEEVIRRANQTRYGLSAGVFTKSVSHSINFLSSNNNFAYKYSSHRDLKRAHRTSDLLQCGVVWINNFNVAPVELPFGGYKMSGIGRECSLEVIQYYTQSKSVYFEMSEIDCPLYNLKPKY